MQILSQNQQLEHLICRVFGWSATVLLVLECRESLLPLTLLLISSSVSLKNIWKDSKEGVGRGVIVFDGINSRK